MPNRHRKHQLPKVLFLVKRKSDSAGYSTFESGLHNSCRLTLEALLNHGLVKDGKVVVCFDGNSIDKELTLFKPNICFIDAVWVTPKKLVEIQRLHKKVKFVIRVHSNIPFLALEGNAIQWLTEYENIPNVTISFNNKKTTDYFKGIFINPIYIPNIYEAEFKKSAAIDGQLNIGCFGAIRPLKNQLIQAVAAINLANAIGATLRFHINASRIEQSGEGILKNMRALFKGKHKLIEHRWLPHAAFMNLISKMDCGLQVSYTESFNIISADFIYSGTPIIVSHDIDWMSEPAKVDPNNAFEIASKLYDVISHRDRYIRRAKKAIKEYNSDSLEVWEAFL